MVPPATRAVRCLSTLHSATSSLRSSVSHLASTTIFSPAHFPKFLAANMLLSGVLGYYAMDCIRHSVVCCTVLEFCSAMFVFHFSVYERSRCYSFFVGNRTRNGMRWKVLRESTDSESTRVLCYRGDSLLLLFPVSIPSRRGCGLERPSRQLPVEERRRTVEGEDWVAWMCVP
jgi:hypothetical protein